MVFKRHNIKHHLFADQAYASTPLHGVDDVRDRLHDCTTDISNWCASRRLQFNEDKTELEWFGKRSRLVQLASMEQTVTVGANVIQPSSVVRDLGCFTRSRTRHDTAHRESDVILLLSAAETPPDTSSSRPGACLSAGSLVRLVEA
jgi:hypothetical protein